MALGSIQFRKIDQDICYALVVWDEQGCPKLQGPLIEGFCLRVTFADAVYLCNVVQDDRDLLLVWLGGVFPEPNALSYNSAASA